jgi:hypothetical protein
MRPVLVTPAEVYPGARCGHEHWADPTEEAERTRHNEGLRGFLDLLELSTITLCTAGHVRQPYE